MQEKYDALQGLEQTLSDMKETVKSQKEGMIQMLEKSKMAHE